MALRADRKEYGNAYRKHFHSYNNWDSGKGSDQSKRLILVYCVECGLKYLIMDRYRLFKVSDAAESIKTILHSHDFFLLLKELNAAGGYSFPPIKTKHDEEVRPGTYHEMCRYCIEVDDAGVDRIKTYDEQLCRIASWLKERV